MSNFNQEKIVDQKAEHYTDPTSAVVNLINKFNQLFNLAAEYPHKADSILLPLENDLKALSLTTQQVDNLKKSLTLKHLIELAFGLAQQEQSPLTKIYNLNERIEENPQIFNVLLCAPEITRVLGSVIVAPILYDNFSTATSLAISEVSKNLSKIIESSNSRENFNQLKIRSVFLYYIDNISSPEPKKYFEATQTRGLLDNNATNICLGETLVTSLLRTQYPVPLEIWNSLDLKSQQEISQHIPLDLLVTWSNGRLETLIRQANQSVWRSEKISVTSVSVESQTVKNKASEQIAERKIIEDAYYRVLQETNDVLTLFNSIYDDKITALKSDVLLKAFLNQELDFMPESDYLYKNLWRFDGVDIEEKSNDKLLFVQRRLQELVGDDLIYKLGELVEVVIHLYCETKNIVVLPKEFVLILTHTIDILGLDPSLEIDDFFEVKLVNALKTALTRMDLPSAQGIRMLYPTQLDRTDNFEREFINEYIESNQTLIFSTLGIVANARAQQIHEAIDQRLSPFPKYIEVGIEDIERFLKMFVSREAINRGEPDLLVIIPGLLSSLLSYDHFDLWGTAEESWKGQGSVSPRALFKGCKLASQLLGKLDSNTNTCETTISLTLKLAETNKSVLSHFISHTNRNLLRALKAVTKGERSFDDILLEYDAALAAERLFIAAKRSGHTLPTPATLRLNASLSSRKLGLEISKFSAEIVTPGEGLPNVFPADYRLLQLYASGMIGQSSDERRKTPHGELPLDDANDARKSHLGNLLHIQNKQLLDLPPTLKLAIFMSILEYGRDVFETPEKSPEKFTTYDFSELTKYLIGGFFINSPDISILNRGQMAILLLQILKDPRAEVVFGKDIVKGASEELLVFSQLSILGLGNPYEILSDKSSITALRNHLHLG